MKVTILVQNGQTGLRLVGSVVDVNKKTAEHWVKYGWAKKVAKPRKKKADVSK